LLLLTAIQISNIGIRSTWTTASFPPILPDDQQFFRHGAARQTYAPGFG
jgi:hypothetical protein